MTPNEKLDTVLKLFEKLPEKDQITCLENLRRLVAEQGKNLAAPV